VTFSLLNLFLILLIAWLAGTLVNRLGYPAVLGELAAGILFGPPLLGWIQGDDGVALIGRLGVLLMMLYVGMRVELKDLMRSAAAACAISIGAFVLPFGLGYLASTLLGASSDTGLVIGTVVGVTALATLPRLTVDLDFVETQLGQTLIGVALFSVAVSLAAYAVVSGVIESGGLDLVGLGAVLGRLAAFVLASVLIGRWLLPLAAQGIRALNVESRTALAAFVFLVGIAYGAMAELAGLHVILGGFLAGLFLDASLFPKRMQPELTDIVRDVALGFATPVFFVSAGFAFSFGAFQSNLGMLLAILLTALAGKFLGGLLVSILLRRGWRQGLVLGMGINGRAGVDIVIAGLALSSAYISQDIFSALIFMTFVTTLSVPIMLKWGVGWLREAGELP
jgi:Kef-type K+ transport system membrane component KefB